MICEKLESSRNRHSTAGTLGWLYLILRASTKEQLSSQDTKLSEIQLWSVYTRRFTESERMESLQASPPLPPPPAPSALLPTTLNEHQPLYRVGEQVVVFYRIGDNDSYLPVTNTSAALRTPRVGQSHGWVPATVMEDYFEKAESLSSAAAKASISKGAEEQDQQEEGEEQQDDERQEQQQQQQSPPPRPGVRIRYNHEKWVDRSGDLLNVSDPRNMLATHPPSRVRRLRPRVGDTEPVAGSGDVFVEDNRTGVARVEVTLSIVMVRWADENCDEVKEGDSGWGPTGAVVSDSYINTWLDAFDEGFSCDYQILSVFVQSTEDMVALAHMAFALPTFLTGRHMCAMYFLWPCQSLDGQHIPSGYSNLPDVMLAMTNMEASGIATRFPHPTHLYKVFLSKDWTSQLCLFPEMRIPATTKVSRSAVERDALGAARAALATLERVSSAQRKAVQQLKGGVGGRPAALNGFANRGVAKLGYSWEAHDVLQFSGAEELAQRLRRLFAQPQGTSEFAFVQELIEDFDCEVRTFVVNGKPVTHARRYTSFAPPAMTEEEARATNREPGRFSQFVRGGKDFALERFFDGDAGAMADAERKVDILIEKYALWLTTECVEMPPIFRFDAFIRRHHRRQLSSSAADAGSNGADAMPDPAIGNSQVGGFGEVDVFAGELTELGACTLGWDMADMVQTLYPPVLGSCLDDIKCGRKGCPCNIVDPVMRVSLDKLVESIRERQARWQYVQDQQQQQQHHYNENGGYPDDNGEDEDQGYDDHDGAGYEDRSLDRALESARSAREVSYDASDGASGEGSTSSAADARAQAFAKYAAGEVGENTREDGGSGGALNGELDIEEEKRRRKREKKAEKKKKRKERAEEEK